MPDAVACTRLRSENSGILRALQLVPRRRKKLNTVNTTFFIISNQKQTLGEWMKKE
jgi:hypothetical protein